MADKQNRGVVILVKPRQQAENLRLGGWLHRVGRLIGNQQARLVGERNRYHHLLAFAFRQFIREAAHRVFMIFYPDTVQQFDGPALAPAETLPPAAFVRPAGDVLHQLAANFLGRIETGLRLLENHRHVMAHQTAALARRQAQQVDIVKAHTVGGDTPVIFGHAANRFCNQAFTGARFAHQPANVAFRQAQAHAIHRFHPAFAGFKFNRQVTNIQQRHYSTPASMARRMPSPSKLTSNTLIIMAAPGSITVQGAT